MNDKASRGDVIGLVMVIVVFVTSLMVHWQPNDGGKVAGPQCQTVQQTSTSWWQCVEYV